MELRKLILRMCAERTIFRHDALLFAGSLSRDLRPVRARGFKLFLAVLFTGASAYTEGSPPRRKFTFQSDRFLPSFTKLLLLEVCVMLPLGLLAEVLGSSLIVAVFAFNAVFACVGTLSVLSDTR